jgi:hypothetical protein
LVLLADLIENPVIREAFFPQDVARFYVEQARVADAKCIRDITALHDGEQGIEIVERSLKQNA